MGYAPVERPPAPIPAEVSPMIAGRAAITLLVIACLIGGCRSPGLPPLPAPSIRCLAAGSTVEPSAQCARAKTYTIEFATFIPASFLLGPWMHPQSYGRLIPPMRLAFAGDDRGFDVDAQSFRAKQVVTVIPDQTDDADGLLDGSKRCLGGITESFDARSALSLGRLGDADRRGALGDREINHRAVAVNTDGMCIDDPIRLGPRRVFVRIRTVAMRGPRNRLLIGSPPIDWDIGITIDTSGREPTYEVAGTWEGYPAAELYINRQPVLLLAPPAGPDSRLDLLKLLPGYGDFRFVKTGKLDAPVAKSSSPPHPTARACSQQSAIPRTT